MNCPQEHAVHRRGDGLSGTSLSPQNNLAGGGSLYAVAIVRYNREKRPRPFNNNNNTMNPIACCARSRKPRIRPLGTRCAGYATPLYPKKLALTSPISGGRSVGIVRSLTKATEFLLIACCVGGHISKLTDTT
jgi:hypothetical protein